MSLFLARALAASLTLSAFAQTPYLVQDIYTKFNEVGGNSLPANFVADGDTVFFSATTSQFGRELWKVTNGQAAMVKDIRPFSGDSNPSALVPIGGGVFLFSATTSSTGTELWRTDGTNAGTFMVKDIHPAGNAVVLMLKASNGKAFFSADDGSHGRELWVSDGTESGTQLAVDFNGTSASSSPAAWTAFGDRFLVYAAGGLWKTDGTQGGTELIKTSLPVRGTFHIIGSVALFAAKDVDHGYELWRTDGTEAGTFRVTDLNPGPADAFPSGYFGQPMVSLGASVVFFAQDSNGLQAWGTDGTAEGTVALGPTPPAGDCATCPPALTAGVGLAFFQSNGLWRTDGTPGGTFLVDESLSAFPLVEAFSAFYYKTSEGDRTFLRRTDGSVVGTTTVMELPSGFSTLPAPAFTSGKLYFRHSGYFTGVEPWVSEDGTAGTTHLLANLVPDTRPSSYPKELFAAGDQLFFRARDEVSSFEVWRTDGTSGGTRKLTSIGSGVNDPLLSRFTPFGGSLYFTHYSSLWRSDGTSEGTGLFQSLLATELFAGSRLLYLNAASGSWPEAMRSDGTEAGTYPLDGESEKPGISSSRFAELAGRVYFWTGGTIWQTEGTPQTTRQIGTDPNGGGTGNPVPAGGALYFVKSTSESGEELWRTDGTLGGLSLAKDIVAGTGSSSPAKLTAAGSYLFFVASDPASGRELWRTDGTEAGTIPLKDIRAGALSSSPDQLTPAAGALFFTADDGINGVELWRSDGTVAGTEMVRDIAAGAASSTPSSLMAADGFLWFAANDGVSGAELWRSDGTAAGTQLFADVQPGAGSASPSSITAAGRKLFFSADGGVTGDELWAMALAESSLSIEDTRIVEGNSGTKTLQFTVRRTGSTTGTASVGFATADATATAGSDYTAASGTLTFDPGQTAKTIDISILGDTTNESGEAFFLVLSTPAGTVIGEDRATGIIENDDARANLTIEALGLDWQSIRFRVANAGPSPATGVSLRATLSPAVGLACGEPCVVSLAPILAEESREVRIDTVRNPTVVTDPQRPPGYTVTGTVTAAEIDDEPDGNRTSRMFSGDGRLTLPAYLELSQSYAAQFVSPRATGASLSSSSSMVAVTPSTLSSPTPGINGTFTLQTAMVTGWTTMTFADNYQGLGKLMLAVVAPWETAKLDVALTNPLVQSFYGQPHQIPVTIAARRDDGTRPSGTVKLYDQGGSLVAQGPLDATASVVLSRNGLPVGSVYHSAEYSGDAFFNPARVDLGNSWVRSAPTSTELLLTRTNCQMVEGTVNVRTGVGVAAAGNVRLAYGANTLIGNVTLTPTGAPGESRATVRLNLPTTGAITLFAEFEGSSSFSASAASLSLAAADCSTFATALYLVTPCRVADSRGGLAAIPAKTRAVPFAGLCGIPATAKAVVLNVTVVAPSSVGWLRLAPSGVLPLSGTSTINYRTGKTRANNSIVALPLDGKIDVYNGGTADTHFLIDVTGYFQ